MTIALLYGCCQIESAVFDLAAARGFMQEVLGAGPIEQQLAAEIRGLFPEGGYDIDHLDCGEAMFQINQPSPGLSFGGSKSAHQQALDSRGNCLTNLNYYIDDHAHARELLTGMGAQILIEGPSNVAKSLGDYGPGNTRPGGSERPFLFFGTRHLIGLDLELMEPNFLRFSEQSAQYPCFVQPRPVTGDGNLRFLRLRLAVADIEAVLANYARMFTPGSYSRPYGWREGKFARACRIGLSGIELEYCQPLGGQGPLAEALGRYGPGPVSCEFAARDVAKVLAKAGERAGPEHDALGLGSGAGRHTIACRDVLGYDVTIEPLVS